MHEAAVADGSEKKRESEIEAENARAQRTIGESDGLTGTEGDVLINAAVFAEGHFTIGAAIKVIKYGLGHAALGDDS
jgi:hypothetical protein